MAKILLPAQPYEGTTLTVLFEGPFPQPAPVLTLRFEGNRLIARSFSPDFVQPGLPQVTSVSATIRAPGAGDYVLVDERCDGLPPPPQPVCSQVSQQGFSVFAAFPVPMDATWGTGLLLLGVAALAAQRIERALTALERLRV